MGREMESTVTTDDFVADSSRKKSRPPRLFIKEMVMRNFKSYVGKQRVGPFHKEPRPVSRLDLEKVLATTTRTNVAVTEYDRLSPQSSGWPFRRGSSDYQGEVEQISLMKPKAQGSRDEGFLEYLEDIIGNDKYVKKIDESFKQLSQLDITDKKLLTMQATWPQRSGAT